MIIVDTSNEIGGDGFIPHPGIGKARRMQVARPELQHDIMIEAVENHMPEVIVIDEIGTNEEAMIYTKVFLYLTYKQIGKTYDVQQIFELLKNNQNINFPLNYGLYELLEDNSYLETAYNQVQKIADTMEIELKSKFLSYPIPKQIIQEWERVS